MKRITAAILVFALALAAAPAHADVEGVVVSPATIAPDGRFSFLPQFRSRALPRWGLALGGGAAWGPAHLGFLMAAADDGLAPDLVAGTSAGALVGADLAAGYGPARSVRLLEESDFGRRLFAPPERSGAGTTFDPLSEENAIVRMGVDGAGGKLPFRGLVSDRLVWNELTRFLSYADAVAGGDLDRLALPMRAVSTDLVTGSSFAPREAGLVRAVRASISLPVFAPVVWDGRVLVDGGTVERVPAPTARGMGAEVVVAVELTEDGKPLGSRFEASSLSGLLFRTFDVAAASQRDPTLGAADVVASVKLGGLSLASFAGNLEELLTAGRAAWAESREAVFAALERASPDTRRFQLDLVSSLPGTDPAIAEDVASSLGLRAGGRVVSALRCELALVAALRRHDGRSGEITIAGGVASVRLEREPEVRRIEVAAPPALAPFLPAGRFAPVPGERPAAALLRVERAFDEARRAGYFLAGLRRVDWDRGAGILAIVVDGGAIARFEGEDIVPAALARVGSVSPDLDEIQRALLRLEAREVLWAPRVGPARLVDAPDDAPAAYAVGIETAPPPRRVTTAALGLADTLGPTFWASVLVPAEALGRFAVETRFVAGGEGLHAGFEARRPAIRGTMPFVRAAIARPRLPRYAPEGWRADSIAFSTQALAAGARWGPGDLGTIETSIVARHASGGGFLPPDPADDGTDAALEARWTGDFRDDPFLPSRGVAWSAGASAPFAGKDRPAVAAVDFEGHVPLGGSGRFSIGALLRAAWASSDAPLPFDRWSEPGAWTSAPPLSPGQGAATAVRRGALVFRARLGRSPLSPFAVGATAAAWRLGARRADPALDRNGEGASLFLELAAPRFGLVTLGIAGGSEAGDSLFLVLGPARSPRPAFAAALPGR